ncbi:MAG: DUF4184 family protein [Promethearchaeota archaeon]
MPFTPFHYPVAWGLSKIDKRLSLPGLIVGSFIPDIEVPILIFFFNGILPDHFIMHSLIGALTIGTLISTILTITLYPIIASLIFGIDKGKIKETYKFSPLLVLSCLLGNLFHILLDLLIHPYNPIFWPFVDPYQIVGILVLVFSLGGDLTFGFLLARFLVYIIMSVLGIAILIKSRKNFWELLLVGKIDFES